MSNVTYVKECKRRKVENATTLATASSPILAPAPAPTQAPSTPDSAPDPLSNTLDGHNLTKEERQTVSKEDQRWKMSTTSISEYALGTYYHGWEIFGRLIGVSRSKQRSAGASRGTRYMLFAHYIHSGVAYTGR